MPTLEVSRVRERQRFELHADGQLAGYISYVQVQGVLVLVHTVILPEYTGKGLAGALAKEVLDELRGADVPFAVSCPYLTAWVHKHPDYSDVVLIAADED